MGDQPEIWKAAAMADHFDKIQKLPDPVPGVPNFRRVPGYKVYCCGQPTVAGFEAALNKVLGFLLNTLSSIKFLGLRGDLPQDGQDHLDQHEAGARRLRQRGARLRQVQEIITSCFAC